MFYFCLSKCSVSSSPRAKNICPFGVALGFSQTLLSSVARSGGRSFFSAPALLFFPFSRVVGGNLLRRIAPMQGTENQ